MEVVAIELVEVHCTTRAFAGGAKRDLAQPADLFEGRRDLVRLGKVSRKLRVSAEAALGSERRDFPGHPLAGHGINHRLG